MHALGAPNAAANHEGRLAFEAIRGGAVGVRRERACATLRRPLAQGHRRLCDLAAGPTGNHPVVKDSRGVEHLRPTCERAFPCRAGGHRHRRRQRALMRRRWRWRRPGPTSRSLRARADLDAVADEVRALGRRAARWPATSTTMPRARPWCTRRCRIRPRHDPVNNAGGAGPNDPRRTGVGLSRRADLERRGLRALIQHCAKPMREAGGGAVVNISSTAARYAQSASVPWCGEGGTQPMTRNLARDFAPMCASMPSGPAASSPTRWRRT